MLNWARHSRVWEINVDSPDSPDVFVNKGISRESSPGFNRIKADTHQDQGRLQPPAVRQLITQMVKDGTSPYLA